MLTTVLFCLVIFLAYLLIGAVAFILGLLSSNGEEHVRWWLNAFPDRDIRVKKIIKSLLMWGPWYIKDYIIEKRV